MVSSRPVAKLVSALNTGLLTTELWTILFRPFTARLFASKYRIHPRLAHPHDVLSQVHYDRKGLSPSTSGSFAKGQGGEDCGRGGYMGCAVIIRVRNMQATGISIAGMHLSRSRMNIQGLTP
jgi:hypothetical protein